jgi:diguanylate cyclase (GGDEF)-like protein
MDFSNQISILSQTKLFEKLDGKLLEEAAEFCSSEYFPRGSSVFKNGEAGDALFVVIDGEVAVTRPVEDGQEQEIARYIAGETFGEMDMLSQTPRNAEARAVLDCELLRFPCRGKSIEDLLKVHPAVAARLFNSFLKVAAGRIRRANTIIAENSPWIQEMRNQIYRDKLTGLFNKVFLAEYLPSFLKDEPLSLMMIKPDNFRKISDTYGRAAEDEALIITAAALSHLVTETVEACRFEGHEFACVFPGLDKKAAGDMAENIRDMLNNLDLSAVTSSATFRLTVNIGIAVYPDHANDAGELIALAREPLFRGSVWGENKILFPANK